MMIRINTNASAAATGGCGDSEISNWFTAVLGVELFDRHTRIRRRLHDVADESFELENPREPVLCPHMRGKLAPVWSDEDELHLVPDHRIDARIRQLLGDSA